MGNYLIICLVVLLLAGCKSDDGGASGEKVPEVKTLEAITTDCSSGLVGEWFMKCFSESYQPDISVVQLTDENVFVFWKDYVSHPHLYSTDLNFESVKEYEVKTSGKGPVVIAMAPDADQNLHLSYENEGANLSDSKVYYYKIEGDEITNQVTFSGSTYGSGFAGGTGLATDRIFFNENGPVLITHFSSNLYANTLSSGEFKPTSLMELFRFDVGDEEAEFKAIFDDQTHILNGGASQGGKWINTVWDGSESPKVTTTGEKTIPEAAQIFDLTDEIAILYQKAAEIIMEKRGLDWKQKSTETIVDDIWVSGTMSTVYRAVEFNNFIYIIYETSADALTLAVIDQGGEKKNFAVPMLGGGSHMPSISVNENQIAVSFREEVHLLVATANRSAF